MSVVVPEITYPPELPVSVVREEIAATIRDHQVVIVAGETGSGKTTQLPKIALELGRTSIAHTQPRRIAARTIAERIAEELDVPLGGLVGYSVRFTDTSGPDTRIRLMTDGILLAEIRRDRELRRYDTIVLDEAHERSLNIDFLLGYLKRLLPRRPDLKVIVTSATIDVERFAEHFAAADGKPAPIVEVSGRTYPVEVRYRPLVVEDAGDDEDDPDVGTTEDRDLATGIQEALDELERDLPGGDVLVFLSGESEIRDVADVLTGRYAGRTRPTEVLPLYGRLSAAEQHRVFERSRTPGLDRRIVLATNVAETSLTVPGIRAVIDGGTARISRYSARAKVQRLPIEAISQASANQRSGRAGRTSAGVAIRLYSEEDYGKRPEYTDPEILRTNLAAVILQMLSLGLGEIEAFPFLTPPDSRGVRAGLDLLRELGAVQEARGGRPASLTRTGRDLARVPIDPRFGRMLLESKRHGVTREVIVIVAGLTVQDPRERPAEQRAQADQLHARFADPTSDLLGLLNLWNHLEEQQPDLSSSAFRRRCRSEFLNFVRIREWQDLVRQLTGIARDVGLQVEAAPRPPKPEGDAAATRASVPGDAIHKSLLAGLLSQIGIRDDPSSASGQRRTGQPAKGRDGRPTPRRGANEFLGARQLRFVVFPGSSLAKRPPRALMSAELVETSRLFARMNAAIDPAWAEPIAGDLVKRTYGEPRWEQRQGAAVADERVTLFGVPIVEKRRIQYARLNPAHARDLFLEHALLGGEWTPPPGAPSEFDRANRRLRAELDEEAERTRSRPVDDQRIVDFYDDRVPADVTDVRRFERWWRERRQEAPDLLTMRRSDLIEEEDEAEIDERDYPPTWQQGDQRLRLGYRFAPGAADDGVTVKVPLPLLAGLSPAGFDWLVPGFREELVTALLRTLPKPIRRHVVPAADWARRLLPELPPGPETGADPGPLVDALAPVVRRGAGVAVAPADFDLSRLPAHLRPAFAVTDAPRGRRGAPQELGRSTDLAALQQRFADRARSSAARVVARPAPGSAPIERTGMTTWDLDALPRVLDTRAAGGVVRAYPALVDTGAAVDVRLLATPEEQVASTRAGVHRLLALATPSPAAYVREHLTGAEKLALGASPYRSTDALFQDCLDAVIDRVQLRHDPDGVAWDRAAFDRMREALAASVVDDLFRVVGAAAAALAGARDADRAIRQATSLALVPALTDARAQLDALIHPGFVRIDGADRLPRIAVYAAGVVHRVERLPEQANRDRVWMTEAQTAQGLYLAAGGTLPLRPGLRPELVHARWLLEELRLSLFAQHLPTAEPVSVQRIRKALA
ncbi:ATP-dependent RNA helicase HrpA [Amnibacterium kyonggiense]|uniref:ATP-dependent helicase HrpA n=1 Tax=Amnibacterium kyonggiense TaxID=595671 RepID=A0A4R7FRS4_9MICO|nr:ATP-dependent RNA helicase HrpA [Amnibacterium kyonggiense]TDS80456.1 ATP-dependent helicase HrpA [Amnibacterium kyonggiense]